MKSQIVKSRVFGTVALNANAIVLGNTKFIPDPTKAYAEFTLGRSFPVVTAYGTCVHPGTVGNCYQSMLHQVVDYDHQMKIYDRSPNKDQIREDKIMGAVVGVEYPPMPHGGWKIGADKTQAPAIHGVMVIHKNASKVQHVLGEHLTGRHKWTVSMEMAHDILTSGFVVGAADTGTKTQRDLMGDQTPSDLRDLGLGYVAVESAPEELLNCFDLNKRRIVSPWGKLPVSLMQGGLNGDVHFSGVGIVRYGAEREAEIQQMLASDPDRLTELGESDMGLGLFTGFAEGLEHAAEALKTLGR